MNNFVWDFGWLASITLACTVILALA